MSDNFRETWEKYSSAWKVESAEEKREIIETCSDPKCQYTDPLIKTTGWDDIVDYMLDFHQQIPGGHFVTTYFLSHSNKSIAKWEMRNAENIVLGDGISYGEYNDNGHLVSMTGFFETPEA